MDYESELKRHKILIIMLEEQLKKFKVILRDSLKELDKHIHTVDAHKSPIIVNRKRVG